MAGIAAGMNCAELVTQVQARRRGRKVLLGCDYDGTLVDIAPRPEEACPPGELVQMLARLAARVDLAVVIVSGRPLEDLRRLLPVAGLNYLGSHGGEGFVQGEPWKPPEFQVDPAEIMKIGEEFAHCLAGLGGWWLESKPLGAAVHFRQATPRQEEQVLQALKPWVDQLRQDGRCHVLQGKKVLEVLPAGLDKWWGLKALWRSPAFAGYFPVYLGDDCADVSVFQGLKGQGLSIHVGPEPSTACADVILESPAKVRRFLAAWLELPVNVHSRPGETE